MGILRPTAVGLIHHALMLVQHRQCQVAAIDIDAQRSGKAIFVAAAMLAHAAMRVDLQSFEIPFGDDVHHTTYGVSAIDR